MFEIELKAHVYNRNKLEQRLSEIAEYSKSVERYDFYYKMNEKTARIRKEITKNGKETENKTEKTFFTYKRKKLVSLNEKIKSEVNNEMETEVEDSEPIETFLIDSGFSLNATKHKTVTDYSIETEFGKASLELCNIETLGDFIEIEILTDNEDKDNIEKIQKKLKELLSLCEIPVENIENKFYSQLLSELKNNKNEEKNNV